MVAIGARWDLRQLVQCETATVDNGNCLVIVAAVALAAETHGSISRWRPYFRKYPWLRKHARRSHISSAIIFKHAYAYHVGS